MLYELLTGRLPFEAETPLAAATRRMVADVPPLVAYRNDIPWPLQEVVLVALRRDASERYKNAHEMAEALRRESRAVPQDGPGERGLWVLGPRSRRQTDTRCSQWRAWFIRLKRVTLHTSAKVGVRRRRLHGETLCCASLHPLFHFPRGVRIASH